MKRLAWALILSAAAWTTPAWAGTQDFTVLNNTGYPIEQLHVSASAQDNWEEDVLGADTLPDGERTRVRFTSDEDACLWDLKVTYEDGETAAWQGIDLCEVSVVALSYDDESGRTWAETE